MRFTAALAVGLTVTLLTGGCLSMLPVFRTESKDVTGDPKFWGGFRPGEVYRVIADTPLAYNVRGVESFDEESPIVAAGTTLQIEQIIRHTGYNAGIQVKARFLDGPWAGESAASLNFAEVADSALGTKRPIASVIERTQ